jgi:hypothetical protein
MYLTVDPELTSLPVDPTYGYVAPDWDSLSTSISQFDHLDDQAVPDMNWARDQMVDMLRYFGVQSKVLKLEEVVFNLSANAGVFYQEEYGNKGATLKFAANEVQEYWDQAHLVDAYPLSMIFPKHEYLPWEKVLSNNTRSIECAPLPHAAFQMRCNQNFNKTLASAKGLPIIVGISFQHGGFDALIRKIMRHLGIWVEGDLRKYDKHLMRALRLTCKYIREKLWVMTDSCMTLKEYKKREEFIYGYAVAAPVLTPWGQVLILPFLKSGDGDTTYDGSLCHAIVKFDYIHTNVPSVTHWRDILNLIGIALYSDDHLECFDSSIHFLAPFARRSEFYALYGLTLKQEDDKIQNEPVGMKLLGATVVWYQGKFAPKYDLGRIWSSIVHNKVDDPVGLYNKMCSLLLLTTFNGEKSFLQVARVLEEYVRIFDVEYGMNWTSRRAALDQQLPLFKKGIPFIPTFDWAINFWLGYESVSGLAIQDATAVFEFILKHYDDGTE